MTTASLRSLTRKDLGQLAKDEGVAGWHSMRKEELVKALVNAARRKARKNGKRNGSIRHTKRAIKNGKSATGNGKSAGNGKSSSSNGISLPKRTPRRVRKFQSTQKLLKLLSTSETAGSNGHAEPQKDRLVAMVRGPYWLHAAWELRAQSVQRAAAALGQQWHSARPVLRLLSVGNHGTPSNAQQVIRDIEIHGGVNHWYVDVDDPPNDFQLEIGYLTENGTFHCLARSNTVQTPAPGDKNAMDANWKEIAQSCDKIFAMSGGYDANGSASELKEIFEERLRRPMGAPLVTRYGIGADGRSGVGSLEFEVDAELIVYGAVSPDAHVSLKGEPIEMRDDGSFTVRMSMPERRQVIPIVAVSSDGVEQRTIVLAVERNTKVMETLIREPEDVG